MFVDYFEYDAFKVIPALSSENIKIYTKPLSERDTNNLKPSYLFNLEVKEKITLECQAEIVTPFVI